MRVSPGEAAVLATQATNQAARSDILLYQFDRIKGCRGAGTDTETDIDFYGY
ncbi:hypothetical protein GCM10009085_35550 [Pseudomonas avellanae]|nr:hypothetical protein GCM10009085_35550 [Pseudomonas avellanae]